MYIYPDYEGDASPLSADEIKWAKSLERILKKAPKRLQLYTIGDPRLTIVDSREFSALSEVRDITDAMQHACGLASIDSGCTIHGIAG